MAKTFVLTDNSLNTHGWRVLTDGIDLSVFEKNPIMLFNHNRTWRGSQDEVLPIGHWENIRRDGDKLLADAVFDNDDFSKKIEDKVGSGTLRMASIGIWPLEFSEDKKYIVPGQRYATVIKCKLKEASIVDIGANHNALALYDTDDNLMEMSAADFPIKKIKIKNDMNFINRILKLKDGADENEQTTALQAIVDENVSLKADLDKEKQEKQGLKDKLDGIELKEKEENTAKAGKLVDEAIKDGRIDDDEKHTAKGFWLRNFEADFKGTEAQLANLPKPKQPSEHLKDDGSDAWSARQKEIEENSRKK